MFAHPTRAQLRKMSLFSVFRMHEARAAALGKTRDDMAAELGMSPSNMQRLFADQNYWPTLPNLARFCRVTGTTLVLDWLLVQVEDGLFAEGGVPFGSCDVNEADLLRSLRDMAREFGELAARIEEGTRPDSEAGSSLSRTEARRIYREAMDLIGRAMDLAVRIRPAFAHTGTEEFFDGKG